MQCPDTMQHRYEANLRQFTIACGVMPCPVEVTLSSCRKLLLSKPAVSISGAQPTYCACVMKANAVSCKPLHVMECALPDLKS